MRWLTMQGSSRAQFVDVFSATLFVVHYRTGMMALSRLVGARPGWYIHEANYLEDNQPEIMSRAHQANLVLIPHIVPVFDRRFHT